MSAEAELTGLTTNKLLKKLYYQTDSPASFSTLDRLYKAAKKEEPLLKRETVKQWLEKQSAYTRHRRVTWKFPRRKVLILRIDYCWYCI